MNQFNYNKLFKPYSGRVELSSVIEWIKKESKADQDIIDSVVSGTMEKLSNGFEFSKQYRGKDIPDGEISRYMLSQVQAIQGKINKTKVKILEESEKIRLESRMRQLVKSEKQMFEARFGTWSQRNIPTFRKWARMKD